MVNLGWGRGSRTKVVGEESLKGFDFLYECSGFFRSRYAMFYFVLFLFARSLVRSFFFVTFRSCNPSPSYRRGRGIGSMRLPLPHRRHVCGTHKASPGPYSHKSKQASHVLALIFHLHTGILYCGRVSGSHGGIGGLS